MGDNPIMPRRAWAYHPEGRPNYYVGWRDNHGRRHGKSIGTKEQAKRYAAKLTHELNADLWTEPVKKSWSEFWAEYLADPDFLQKAASTQRLEEDCEKIFRKIVKPLRVRNISAADVLNFRRARFDGKRKAISINKELRMLRYWFGRGVRLGFLVSNPADPLPLLRVERTKPKIVTWANYRRFRASCNGLLPLYADILWFTGLRAGEALAIKWSDIDFDNWTLAIQQQKTGKHLVLPIHEALHESLSDARLVSSATRLFPWTADGMRCNWSRACKRSGVVCNRQQFRSSFATHLQESGVGLSVVQALLGHSSPTTTAAHYTNIDNDTLRAAVDNYRQQRPSRKAKSKSSR
jgi:integrase